jgi:hypothetical protein
MSPGTFETHKKYYIKKTAYLADANNHKPAAKNNPWLKQFRDETRRRSLPLTEYSTVIIGRKGTEFFYFLHPHKKYYMAYCTDCGWIGGLNNWQKHAVKHQTTVLDDKAEMDAELAYFTPPIQEMPEVDEEEEEVEEDKVEEDDEMGDAAVEGEGWGKQPWRGEEVAEEREEETAVEQPNDDSNGNSGDEESGNQEEEKELAEGQAS